jgi:hypothetical protein
LPQLNFLPLRNGGLRGEAAENELTGAIQPVPRKRVDHLPPNALFEDVEIRRRLRTPLARDAGDNGKLSGGFAGHLKRPLDGSS